MVNWPKFFKRSSVDSASAKLGGTQFKRTTLPAGVEPTSPPRKAGLASVYVEHGMYLVDDPRIDDSILREYNRITDEVLEWMDARAFVTDSGVIEALRANGVQDPVLMYYVSRELMGYGVLQPMMDDPEV
ncbi:MAG: hypothetical protein QXI37_02495, partial [Thermoprotei archaeon]